MTPCRRTLAGRCLDHADGVTGCDREPRRLERLIGRDPAAHAEKQPSHGRVPTGSCTSACREPLPPGQAFRKFFERVSTIGGGNSSNVPSPRSGVSNHSLKRPRHAREQAWELGRARPSAPAGPAHRARTPPRRMAATRAARFRSRGTSPGPAVRKRSTSASMQIAHGSRRREAEVTGGWPTRKEAGLPIERTQPK
jgi:hypothetical protein